MRRRALREQRQVLKQGMMEVWEELEERGMDLIEFARYGDLHRVKQLIQKGSSVNSVNGSGQTALFCACECGHYNVAEFLLMSGALVNYKAKPLIAAAREGHADVVDLLLKHGADVSGRNGKRETAMSVAVQKMNVSVILLLIDHGVRPHMPLESFSANLFTYAKADDAKTLHKMLTNGTLSIKSDDCLVAAFKFAFEHHSLELASDLLSQHSSSKLQQFYPLAVYCSVRNNWYDILTKLLKKGASVNVTLGPFTPLYAACALGSEKIVCLLLRYGANPNVLCEKQRPACETRREQLPSHHQKKHCNVMTRLDLVSSSVVTLMSCGADPSFFSGGLHPLSVACEHRHREIVKLLLEYGADIQATDEDSKNALYCALLSELSSDNSEPDFSTVNLLLDYGADTNTMASSGENPLYLACSKGLTAVVQRMLKCGAKVNVGKDQKSPLIAACENNHAAIVELLLSEGADPNVQATDENNESPLYYALQLESISSKNLKSTDTDSDMVTKSIPTKTCELPLCIAVKKGNCELATLLLNYGANVNMLNLLGESALYIALQKPFHEINASMTQLLLERGADVNQLMLGGLSPVYFVLLESNNFQRLFYDRDLFQRAQIVDNFVRMLIANGAKMDDSLWSTKACSLTVLHNVKILEALCEWHSTDQVSIELLKSGAGFILLALSCMHKFGRGARRPARCMRLCQAAIMAGYVPSSDELEVMQQSVSGENMFPEHVELLSWLNEDKQQTPSLMRQCRVAIRRQLSVASCHRTILPAIDQLPLPTYLQQYLKFEGTATEVQLEVEAHEHVFEATDSEEASTSSMETNESYKSEWSGNFDYSDSEHGSEDYVNYYDSDDLEPDYF